MIIEERTERDKGNEGLMRRFSRTVKSSGMLRRVKSRRHFERKPSKRKQKEAAIRSAKTKAEYEFGVKTGRIQENQGYGRRKRR